MKPEINQPYCFLLPTCKGGFFLNTENIIRVQALSNYCKLFFTDGTTLVVAKVLKWFEEKLPAGEFIRIHRSHLVNREQLLAIGKADNRAKLTLRNGEVMQVSRRKKEWVLYTAVAGQISNRQMLVAIPPRFVSSRNDLQRFIFGL